MYFSSDNFSVGFRAGADNLDAVVGRRDHSNDKRPSRRRPAKRPDGLLQMADGEREMNFEDLPGWYQQLVNSIIDTRHSGKTCIDDMFWYARGYIGALYMTNMLDSTQANMLIEFNKNAKECRLLELNK